MSKHILKQCEKYNDFFDEALKPEHLIVKPSPIQRFLEAFVPEKGILVLKHTVDRSANRQHGHIETYQRKEINGATVFMSLLLDDETKLGRGNIPKVNCYTPSGHALMHEYRESGKYMPESLKGVHVVDMLNNKNISLNTLGRYIKATSEKDFYWSYYEDTNALRATANSKEAINELFAFEPHDLIKKMNLRVGSGNSLEFGERVMVSMSDLSSIAAMQVTPSFLQSPTGINSVMLPQFGNKFSR